MLRRWLLPGIPQESPNMGTVQWEEQGGGGAVVEPLVTIKR